jgi:hypothetical protein
MYRQNDGDSREDEKHADRSVEEKRHKAKFSNLAEVHSYLAAKDAVDRENIRRFKK